VASNGFAISIGVVDQASAKLDALNKRIAAMRAPAERFNKSLAKFADTSGINRLSEGMSTLGDRTLGFARSIERAASPMAALTSAATIGGVIELSRQWAKAGNSIGNVAYALSMPVERMSSLQNGAKLAGSSVEAMTKSLQGANEVIKDAQFHRADAASPLWQQLGIQPVGPDGKPIEPDELLRQFAEATKNMTPHARMRAETAFGIDTDLDPMLREGAKGFDAYVEKAQKTGAGMTHGMTENAKRLSEAWNRLGLDIEGINNRISDSWAGTETKVLKATSDWIEHNKGLSDSFAQVGTAVLALGMIKPAAWLARWLGMGAVAGGLETAATVAPLAAPLALSGDTPAGPDYQEAPGSELFGNNGPIAHWWGRHAPSWLGGASSSRKTPADPSQLRSYFKSQGWTDPQVAGILANYQGESGLDAGAVGDQGAAGGLGMWRDDRRKSFRLMFGHDVTQGTPLEQAQFTQWELTHTERAAGDALRNTTSAREAGAVFSRDYERPQDVGMNASLRGQYAETWMQRFGQTDAAAQNGAVHVTVDLKGAPPGTTATAVASGVATASPPRVQTSMAGIQ